MYVSKTCPQTDGWNVESLKVEHIGVHHKDHKPSLTLYRQWRYLLSYLKTKFLYHSQPWLSETTRTLVPWRQGFRHPTRNGSPKSSAPYGWLRKLRSQVSKMMRGPWRPPRVQISGRMLLTNQKAPGMTRIHTGPTCEGRCFGGCHGAMLAAHDPLRNPPSIPPSLCTFLFYSLPFLPSILRSVLARYLLWPTGMFALACRSFPR